MDADAAPGHIITTPVPEREAASAARRFGAALLDWLAAGLALVVLTAAASVVGGPAIGIPFGPPLAFFVINLVGRGPGELACDTEIVDADTGGRLLVGRAMGRAAVQLFCAYVVAMATWLLAVVFVGAMLQLFDADTEHGMLAVLYFVPVVLIAPALAEAIMVRFHPRRLAPWDVVAHARVVRR